MNSVHAATRGRNLRRGWAGGGSGYSSKSLEIRSGKGICHALEDMGEWLIQAEGADDPGGEIQEPLGSGGSRRGASPLQEDGGRNCLSGPDCSGVRQYVKCVQRGDRRIGT